MNSSLTAPIRDFTRLALKGVAQVTVPLKARFVIGCPNFADPGTLAKEIEAAGFDFRVLPGGHGRHRFPRHA